MVTSHTLIKDSIAAITVAGIFCGAVLIADAYHSTSMSERIIVATPAATLVARQIPRATPEPLSPATTTSDRETSTDTGSTSTQSDTWREPPQEPNVTASPENSTGGGTVTTLPTTRLTPPTLAPTDVTPTPTPVVDSVTFTDNLITLIEQRTNAFRKKQGLEVLTSEPALERNARKYSQTMLTGNFLAHTDKSGCDLTCRFTADTYQAQAWGENLARLEFSDMQTAEAVADYFMTEWQKSAGHRKNLLSPVFTHQGIGVARTDHAIYVTVHFAQPL